MASFSQITIIGNCTRAPEMKSTRGGTSFATTGIAVNKRVGKDEKVSYFNVTFWGKTAEVAVEYLKRGAQVLASGEMEQERWEKDGQKHERWVLNAHNMQLLGGRPSDQQSSGGAPRNTRAAYSDGGEDVPF